MAHSHVSSKGKSIKGLIFNNIYKITLREGILLTLNIAFKMSACILLENLFLL